MSSSNMTSKPPSDPPSPPPPPPSSTAAGPPTTSSNDLLNSTEDPFSSTQFLSSLLNDSFAFDDLDWDWEPDQNQEQLIENYTDLYPLDSIDLDFEFNDQYQEQTFTHTQSIPSTEMLQQQQPVSESNVKVTEIKINNDVNDDGYDWKKYGNKQVKGGEIRSYYKCKYPECLVKKKVETSSDDVITRIVYLRDHNHAKPQSSKQSSSSSGSGRQVNDFQGPSHGSRQPEFVVTQENLADESQIKRMKVESEQNEDNKVSIRTVSDIDILIDGYKWKKYGQKLLKENPNNPRSYFRCTTPKCPVRKQVERAPDDIKSVITTYEFRHNHPVPVDNSGRGKSSSQPVYSTSNVGTLPVYLPSQASNLPNNASTLPFYPPPDFRLTHVPGPNMPNYAHFGSTQVPGPNMPNYAHFGLTQVPGPNMPNYASTLSFYPPPDFAFTRVGPRVQGPNMNQQQMFPEEKDEPKDGSK